jgi:hypothetical protein
MTDADDVLRRLLSAPKIDGASLASVPTEQRVYVLWLSEEPPACLKVGIAGPRRGKGLREALRNHFGSHTSPTARPHGATVATSRTGRNEKRSSLTAVIFRLWRFRPRRGGNSNSMSGTSAGYARTSVNGFRALSSCR